MDHLLAPPRPIFKNPKVKYACLAEYDWRDFCSYPARAGWSDEDIFAAERWNTHISSGRRTLDEVESFLQTWLFFGSLHSFFGDSIKLDDFVTRRKGKPTYIHTKNLEKAVSSLLRRIQKHGVSGETIYNWQQALKLAQRVYDVIARTQESFLHPMFAFSLGTLIHFLSGIFEYIYRQYPGWLPDFREGDFYLLTPHADIPMTIREISGQFGEPDFLKASLVASGWCPQLAGHLGMKFRGELMYYMLRMGPPDCKNHGACNFERCNAYQIDRVRYKHLHVRRSCNCKHALVDPNELCSILEGGYIPVVKVQRPGDSRGYLKLHPALPSEKYVAISHVWSDGLGNPLENSIASCQLRRILTEVRKIPGLPQPSAFWLDTLCCPVRPIAMRRQAIRMMRQTYEEADAVLVLDGRLNRFSINRSSPVEVAARILTSGWMRRLWTWQEGALAKRRYFAFQDQLFDSDIFPSFVTQSRASVPLGEYRYWVQVSDVHASFRAKERIQTFNTRSLSHVLGAVSSRRTSVAADESLCLASVMGCNLDSILEAEPEDRMLAFWKVCPAIPTDLVFSTHTRLATPGFRWAPKTLLDNGEPVNTFGFSNDCAIPTARGLSLTSSGALLLNALDQPMGEDFWIRDEVGRWLFLVHKMPHSAMHTFKDRHFSRPVRDERDTRFTQAAILIDTDLVEDGDTMAYVLLVYIYSEEDGVLFARSSQVGGVFSDRQCHLRFPHRWNEMRLRHTADKSEGEPGYNITDGNAYQAVEWKRLPKNQKWCID